MPESQPRPGPAVSRDDLVNPDLKAADVMTTGFRSCNATTPIEEAVAIFRMADCGILPVTRAQVPIGVLTDRDVALALTDRGCNLSGLTAGDLMTRDVATIAMEAPLDDAAEQLGRHGVRRLLVVSSEGALKGVLSWTDLIPHLSEGALGRVVSQVIAHREPAPLAKPKGPQEEPKSSKSQAQPHPWDSPTGEHPAPIPLVSEADLVNPMLEVADVMTAGPRTCSPQSTALEAVLIFRDAGCGVIPVVDGGKPVGVLTDRDVALALAGHEADLARTPVGDLMTKDVVTIESDQTLDVAVDRLGGARPPPPAGHRRWRESGGDLELDRPRPPHLRAGHGPGHLDDRRAPLSGPSGLPDGRCPGSSRASGVRGGRPGPSASRGQHPFPGHRCPSTTTTGTPGGRRPPTIGIRPGPSIPPSRRSFRSGTA